MVKIIVAFPSDDKCTLFSSTLEEAGYPVFRQCTSGSEVKRALNECRDGVVICPTRLPDCTADDLAWDLHGSALLLVTGRPQQLELCEHPDIFRLASPFSKGELTSAVGMLLQFYQMRIPKRTGQERQTIAQAKEKLMKLLKITEPEAHHYLQQIAMDRGMKMAQVAAKVLENEN